MALEASAEERESLIFVLIFFEIKHFGVERKRREKMIREGKQNKKKLMFIYQHNSHEKLKLKLNNKKKRKRRRRGEEEEKREKGAK